MDTFFSNLRFAARSLRKNPALTAVALATLALGIGANTAIFSVVDTVVLRPLPYPEPHRLVRVWPEQSFTKELLDAFAERTHAFSALSGYSGARFSVSGSGRPEVIPGAVVSPSHFTVMGVDPVLGRSFLAEEGTPGADGVAVIGHGLWQRRFGGEDVLGRTLEVNGRERTIVGVMPAGYQPLLLTWEIWTPLAIETGSEAYRDYANLRVVARVADGLGTKEARADVRALAMELHQEQPDRLSEDGARAAGVVALREAVVRGIRPTLLALFGAVGLVLLIACANVSNLLLARAGARRREIAVRTALGADRWRLTGQLLTESALLAVLGGGLGVLGAAWILALIGGRLPAGVPRASELAVDGRVLGFALAASLLSVLIFGLVPALRGSRPDVFSSLKAGGRGGGDTSGQPLSRALISIEIALAVVVVAGAGLLGKSFWNLQQTELGFRPENTLSLHLSPTFGESERLRTFYASLVERVEGLPGVTSAGVVNNVPMSSGSLGVDYSTADHPTPPGQPAPFVSVKMVSEDTLQTLGVPLLHGRSVQASDRADGPRVGLINRTLARRLWGEEESVGRELRYGDGSEWFTIVGVVGDIRQRRLDLEPGPEVYVPYRQNVWERYLHLVVRASSDPAALVPAVREAVGSVDDAVAISRVRTLAEVVEASLATSRFRALLFAFFALLAMILGAVGIYGVTATAVGRRRHEHGVRLALGATAGALLRHAMSRELVPVALGLAAGVAGAAAATRALTSFLHEVSPADPWVFAAVVAVLGGCAVLAAYLPARWAARVDPVTSLRVD